MQNKRIYSIIRWVVALAIPFFLTLGTVRFLIAWESPSYPQYEYGRIAPDRFGFTQQERLELADATLSYLQRPEAAGEVIYLLEDLRIPGTDTPLYNEREIGHMLDVKNVADIFKRVLWFLAIIVVGGLIILWIKPETRDLGAKAVKQGGIFAVALVGLIIFFMFVAWSMAFTLFHNLFFSAGTWTFNYSDSLIRLFPEQFWFDFGLLWFGLILLEGIILALVGHIMGRRWA
ncbi:MAG: TIGR01906 family membrane protein [Candidatus Promineifilaceae bacterium]|nr:TIGR01906 family membrane protein [Candidatus Promineifilaceae bacterium]